MVDFEEVGDRGTELLFILSQRGIRGWFMVGSWTYEEKPWSLCLWNGLRLVSTAENLISIEREE